MIVPEEEALLIEMALLGIVAIFLLYSGFRTGWPGDSSPRDE